MRILNYDNKDVVGVGGGTIGTPLTPGLSNSFKSSNRGLIHRN